MRAETTEQPHAPRRKGKLRHGNRSGDPATAPRCGARTRRGTPCKAPRVRGRVRCRMHGGTAGSGAPIGNRNAWRHGERSAEAQAERRRIRALLTDFRAVAVRLARRP
ncbi:MAG: HGGxSTG domain-containing protein [Pirellulales bacterium]